VGKKNWYVIDSIRGADASAVLYSITETAKMNNLKPYEYVKHLLEELPKHGEYEDLLSWTTCCRGLTRCRTSAERIPASPDRRRRKRMILNRRKNPDFN
jgi:hypothetical protein